MHTMLDNDVASKHYWSLISHETNCSTNTPVQLGIVNMSFLKALVYTTGCIFGYTSILLN